jgi:hypothetical protein
LKVPAFEPYCSEILAQVYDYVLRLKRDYLKDLSEDQILLFCESLLDSLDELDRRVVLIHNYVKSIFPAAAYFTND